MFLVHVLPAVLSILLCMISSPLSAITLSEFEKEVLRKNADISYVYLGEELSNIASFLSYINDIDQKKGSSIVNILNKHIQDGFLVADRNAVLEALTYAERVLKNNHRTMAWKEGYSADIELNSIMCKIENGTLLIDAQRCCEDIVNDCCDFANDCDSLSTLCTSVIGGNLVVKGRTILKKNVHAKQCVHVEGSAKFEKNVAIKGILCAADAIIENLSVTDLAVVNCMNTLCVNTLSVVDESISGTLSITNLSVTDLAVANCMNTLCVNALSVGDESISGTLSAINVVAGDIESLCNVTVGCNINMNDSVDASIGNIVKNGTPFIHNFGTDNTFVGKSAGNFTMTGSENVGIGTGALGNNTFGDFNTAVGVSTLTVNTGSNNTAVGGFALTSNTTGFNNVAVGVSALLINTAGFANTALGAFALSHNTIGAGNTAVGTQAMQLNTIGGNNTAVGGAALSNNTTGISNTAMGSGALGNNISGSHNAAVGHNTLVTSDADNNTALGDNALVSVTTGGNNIALGANAGVTLTTGTGNIYINADAVIGTESDTIRIGSSQTSTFIAGVSGVTTGGAAVAVLVDASGQLGTISSSQNVKHDIQDMGNGSNNVLNLRPVTFVYNGDAANLTQYGLIAEEVEKVFPAIVVKNQQGQPQTVQYHVLPVLLLNEVKKLQVSMEQIKEVIAQMQAREKNRH